MTNEKNPAEKAGGDDVEKGDKLPANKEDKKSLIQEAKEAATELRKANEEKKNLLKKEEELIERKEALLALGGDSKKEVREEPQEATPEKIKEEMGEIGW